MNFKKSLEYLLNLGNEVLAMKLGLENIGKLLKALGNPEKNFVKIQVAGTNGKGSTCAFLDSICVSAKIKTGLFTSPHLVSITERIKIKGKEISEEDFARHATKIRKFSEKLLENGELETLPTFFEQVTAIAISAFDEAKIDLAILETGLGGRFDATTATNAEIVAITPIDFDHQDILGNTLAKIASEKAAIIRADTKVVLSEQLPEAKKVITKACAKFAVTPNLANFDAEIIGVDQNGKFIVNFKTTKAEYKNARINLLGKHQIENAKLAVLLAETLQEDNFNIAPENIIGGLQTAVHKGRLEFYKGILFDGAHNVAGAKALKNYLDEFVKKPITLIFGAMRDKDLEEIAKTLFPKANKLILTKPDNPRSMEAKDLLKFLPKDVDRQKVFETRAVDEAVRLARKISSAQDLICITGSLYLVGEAQKQMAAGNKQ
jgi:dihydrofolate synthase/folylpolyglutamate synthase